VAAPVSKYCEATFVAQTGWSDWSRACNIRPCMGNRPRSIYNNPKRTEKREGLRNEGTAAEAVLWTYLQKRQLLGKKFRRQYSIGPYIVDFYCPECSLVVEVDGARHFSMLREDYELERTRYLLGQGLQILRFENRVLRENAESVLEGIREAIRKRQTNY
jgi:very-short-patch-repair endonuclease